MDHRPSSPGQAPPTARPRHAVPAWYVIRSTAFENIQHSEDPVISSGTYRIVTQYGATDYDEVAIVVNRQYQELATKVDSALAKILAATSVEAQATRDHLTAEVGSATTTLKQAIDQSTMTITNCLRHNAAQTLETLSIWGLTVLICSLLVSILFGFHIVHPFVALLSSVALGSYWVSARLSRKVSPRS